MVNKVEVINPPRTVAWQTGHDKGNGELEFGGWIWRSASLAVAGAQTGE